MVIVVGWMMGVLVLVTFVKGLVGLMAVVLMLAVIVKFVVVLQIWLRSIHMFCILRITTLKELLCW